LLKKSSGNAVYDFGQIINLPFIDGWDQEKIMKFNQKKEKIPKLIQVIK